MEKQQPWGTPGTPCHPQFSTGAIQGVFLQPFCCGLIKMDVKCCCGAAFEGAFHETQVTLRHPELSD